MAFRVAVILKEASDWTANALLRNLKKRGVSARPLKLSEVSACVHSAAKNAKCAFSPELRFDAFLVRDVGGILAEKARCVLENISFKFDILRILASHKIVMNSPEAIQNAANKFYSTVLFSSASLPVPKTVVTGSVEVALNALEDFGGSAVAKPIFGHQGKGVEKITLDASAREKIQRIIAERGVIYLQEFIPNAERDIRVFVVGDEIVGAIYRVRRSGSIVSNLSMGGKAVRCEPTAEMCEIALKATKAIGADFAGVDLVERLGDGKIFILEINGTPSAKGIKMACGVDATEKIVDLLIERLKN